ncbi:unnamed protein product [Meganyctiphanes norvegica]|uniref:Sulfotransferase domain-containing protein n=1 Tax=Meganyctiphanes norvegica TaxID=48144 RepID=A0AAV2PLF8_MEGNR
MSELLTNNGRKIEVLDEEELCERGKDFDVSLGFVRVQPGRYLLRGDYVKMHSNYYNFQFRQDDVLCLSWPKCGQTWTLELLWNMKHNPNLDNPLAKQSPNIRTPFFEFDMITGISNSHSVPEVMEAFERNCPGADPNNGIHTQLLASQKSPRIIKSHIPLSLWPDDLLKGTKVVYVARNPKDAVVSYEHFSRINKVIAFKKDMDTFIDYFVKDDLMYGPYWQHLREAWEARNKENFLLLFYEDMIHDIIGQLKKIDKYIGTNLTDKQLENVANHCSFNSMKGRITFSDNVGKSPEGGFFRKGKVGSWREKLASEQADKIDQWTKEHLSDIPFKYEV